ncbi:GntR family transcriptional regulator [Fulvimarina endophytica]|uniref:GntR family transcriptional regulator n=1 Tax=Fulvimarina endophytica TaxID=2293836 RepID=A0A371WYX2_9HYPH|nr:GntR family transcriptional regulator [Fulvimarina endophytica]RFC62190.1 GntR family transcriptional regulator [Fulvimarina endophytica]
MGFTDMGGARVDQQSLSEQVRTRIEAMLVGGELRPNDRTSIRELAENLGVSTMPIRDAVSRLVANGALAIERNRAVIVPLLSIEDFEDLTRTRVLTEAEAARKAAGRVSAADIADLAAINEEFVAAMGDGRGRDAVRINQRLHFRLYDCAASPSLSRIIASNWLQAGPMINLDIGLPVRSARNENSLAAHAELLEALKSGDSEGAAAAIVRDIETAAASIITTIREG